ncbi:hypothetical protein CENSYa_1104 [Cenarchaeum symbiosum A]|uniref:Uncharacterized protein n=1 Tax=Cenarchaeum symbiosum (strain A) TaxID=414004 RepID=A0RWL6_CENSY|nr:hypothetical protein CENSYa_1104 [Cenarchaeum symbiosum A]
MSVYPIITDARPPSIDIFFFLRVSRSIVPKSCPLVIDVLLDLVRGSGTQCLFPTLAGSWYPEPSGTIKSFYGIFLQRLSNGWVRRLAWPTCTPA